MQFRRRTIVALAVAALLLGGALARPGGGRAADEQCFPETGKCVQGRFLAYWRDHGGLAINGYPLSGEFRQQLGDGNTYTVQYFERVRMEYHSQNPPPYDVLLGQFGRAIHPADPAVPPSGDGAYFPQTGHNVRGAFLDYWAAHGGLAQFGYPLSEEFRETLEDGKTYTVQYFERARFELHPETGDPAAVELGQFGRRIFATSLAALQQPCAAGDLAASLAWQGATGALGGPLVFVNQSHAPCALTGRPGVALVDGQGRTLSAQQQDGPPVHGATGAGVILQPQQGAIAIVQWRNWCGQPPAAPLAALVTLPGNGGQLRAVIPGPPATPRCDQPGAPSTLAIAPFEIGDDIAANLVRSFYGAINNRDYRTAYGLLGAAWHERQSYADFAAGFAGTAHDALAVVGLFPTGAGRGIVTVQLAARQADGTVLRFQGDYEVAPENGALKLVAAHLALVGH
ncbi:MAG TPA: DUF4232 domain-containing protein [Thermomicrobiales bacterium]|nr:DUF4232 domain-containing protein [Thermomicrobiales bacterium]